MLQEYRRWGGRWASVAAQLGRSGLGCRNRWRLLERRKNQASGSGQSPSCVSGDQGSISGKVRQVSPKDEAQETGETQIHQGPDSPRQAEWGELLAQLQYEISSQNSSTSGSNMPVDLNIPMDPSLANMFDSTSHGPYQFDARLWDIMNGGCGCGCGSKQLGCSCGDTMAPPFLEIPTESFLDPFHQLSQTFAPSETPPQSHLAPLSVSSSLPSRQIDFPPRSPENHTAAAVSCISQPRPAPFMPFSTLGGEGSSLPPNGGLVQFSSDTHIASSTTQGKGGTSPPPVHGEPSSAQERAPSALSAHSLVKRTLSPRTLAILEDLPRQLQGIDAAKFVAAIALSKVKDGAQTSCRCVGACCAPSPLPVITVGSAPTEGTNTLPSRKKCCSVITQAVDSSSPASSRSRRKPEGKRSRSPPPEDSLFIEGKGFEPSAKRTKTKASLLPRLSSHLKAVAGDNNILPYACGDPNCWRSDEDIRARFNTSGELLDHWRREHEVESAGDERVADGKAFRCALEGCGKGWKVLVIIMKFVVA